ncbi:MAG: tetratricopeptide repeat protein [Alphaproteobacteria bacterium]|nr:tetratricopeptide repeat protein [Alphaproteobacteria bacterium]
MPDQDNAQDTQPEDERDFGRGAQDFFKRFKVEIDPDSIDDSLREMGTRIRGLYDQGRYTKVRVSYRGKQIGPDIPMAVFLAGEVASFWWAGPMRAVLLNLGIRTFIEVELVHEADGVVRQGVDLYMEGEVDAAEERYRMALKMRPSDTAALYNLGVLLRVTGRKDESLDCFRRAATDEEHPDGARARETLGRMGEA